MTTASRRSGLALAVVAGAAIALLGAFFMLLPGPAARCPGGSAWVVLDPGHGGDDPGAINEDAGLVERELALEIAERAAALLRAEGYGVALTREDVGPGMANTPRGRIANACNAMAYVSIHLNAFDDPAPNYAMTLWGIEAKDRAFAEAMQASLVAELRPGADLGDSGVDQLENGGLLTARMPAAMVEPLFLTNPEEAARLADPDGERIDAIARAIARGVAAWLRAESLGAGMWMARPGPVVRPGDPLLAAPRGSAERALDAALARGAFRADEVRAYVDEVYRLAPLVGLDPAIVVAQSAHETGWWRSPAWVEHLNPAGIGITGPDAPSPTWDNGIDAARAQIVHLILYARGEIAPDDPLSPYVDLDPRYGPALDAGRAGIATTIDDLAGTWATDPNYGQGVSRAGTALLRLP